MRPRLGLGLGLGLSSGLRLGLGSVRRAFLSDIPSLFSLYDPLHARPLSSPLSTIFPWFSTTSARLATTPVAWCAVSTSALCIMSVSTGKPPSDTMSTLLSRDPDKGFETDGAGRVGEQTPRCWNAAEQTTKIFGRASLSLLPCERVVQKRKIRGTLGTIQGAKR